MSDREPADGCQVSSAGSSSETRRCPGCRRQGTVGISDAAPTREVADAASEERRAEPGRDSGLGRRRGPATTAVLRLVLTSTGDAGDGAHTEQSENGGPRCWWSSTPATTAPPAGWIWQDLDAEVIAAARAGDVPSGRGLVGPRACRGLVAAAASVVPPGVARACGSPGWSSRWRRTAGRWWTRRGSTSSGICRSSCAPHRRTATSSSSSAAPNPSGMRRSRLGPGRADAGPLVPEVIAVDDAQGWMLMRDLGAVALGDQDESLWHEGLVAHADVQRSWLGRTEELVASRAAGPVTA